MITVRISEETYDLICGQVASLLEGQMFGGRVSEWDELNEQALRALLELNSGLIQRGAVG